MDAIAVAQVLSEIGYLLRQDPKEVYRARAFSAAAWALALERPDLDALHKENKLTAIEGVGAGIAKVLAGLVEDGRSSYLERLRAETGQPSRDDESVVDLAAYQGDHHSPRIKVVNGLDAERLLAQSREREQVEKEVVGLALLQGIEVDILEDGSLDLPDAVLELLDVVVASPHVKLRQEAASMTERMLRAVSNPNVDIVGHPTGRRPGSREGASYDFELVFREAARHGVALEIDCDPARMDLSPEHARLALECGCNFSLDADAHAPAEFAYVPMAAWMARRAGIPMDRILNFKPLEGLTMIAK